MKSTLLFLFILVSTLSWSTGFSQVEPPSGIQPLRHVSLSDLRRELMAHSIRPLFTSEDQEAFLRELEREPPPWPQLYDQPGEEHGERLFAFNRQRDERREGHPLLQQRIGFLWSGLLREFHDTYEGYRVVLGPEFTETSWGLVRFKPTGLPHEMVAIPPTELRPHLKAHLAQEGSIDIIVLFTGRLIPWESIIYGFSHDGEEQGMVMPVVRIEGVQYILR